MKFLDEAKVFIKSGDGGGGAISFRREKFVEFGGPDGGDGGDGGSVYILAVPALNTLIDYRYRQHFKAEKGHHGMGKNRTGSRGKDIVLKAPVGTQVFYDDKTSLLCDLTHEGQRFLLASGGQGGRGNIHFKSSRNQAPRRADPGGPGEELWLWLRLKLIADVGLVGMPNAGKSTLLSVVSRARPKIADYPFTTLHPNLGVIHHQSREIVMADIPGLIEGAHSGVGLGTRFLGHVERTRVLLHLIDGTQEDVGGCYRTIRQELERYDMALAQKPEITVLTKGDSTTAERHGENVHTLEAAGAQHIFGISAQTRAGLDALLDAVMGLINSDENKTPNMV